MRLLVINADRGIRLDGAKGAAAHLRATLAALRFAGCEVSYHGRTRADEPELDALDASLDGHEFDAVYERYSLGHSAGLEFARQRRLPFLLEVNAPLVDEARAHRPATLPPGAEALEARLWSEADFVFAVSTQLVDRVTRVRGSANGVIYHPNGVDPSRFPIEESRSAGPPWSLAFLGNPKPWHGTRRLPGLFRGLQLAGVDARLIVIGGGRGAEAMIAEFGSLGLSDRIEVTGELDQTSAIARLQSCHLSMAPYEPDSDFYFCPLKVLESMAAGTPLVASRIGDIPRLCGPHASLADPGDDPAFLKAVMRHLDDEAFRLQRARAARDWVVARYTWDHNAERILEVIGSLEANR